MGRSVETVPNDDGRARVHADAHAGGRAGERADGRAGGRAGAHMDEHTGARTDKRVMRSRKVMIDAFEHLLRAKPYEDITVTDIAREADVDRKTFYKHFGSIDGLLAYILDRHIAEIVESTHALLFRDGELLEQDLDERLRTFFDMVNVSLMTNISLNRRVFECVPFDLLLSCVKASMLEELRRYGAVPRAIPAELLEYYLSFVFGGILAAYRRWIASDGGVPIESVSSAVSALVAEGIASIAFPPDAADSILGS